MRSIQYLLLTAALFISGCLSSLADDQAEQKQPEQVSVFGSATLAVPPEFVRAERANRIIEHEFKATVGDKSARITMMAASGGVEANLSRWKDQFIAGEIKPKSEQLKLGDWKVYLVDLNGTYKESSGGGPFAPGKITNRADYAMAGAVLQSAEGRTYFVKMIGPAEVIEKHRKSFVKMIKSIDE